MSSELQRVLRRLKPEKRLEHLERRNERDLPFLDRVGEIPRKLLYDTTVYIDVLQDRFPRAEELALRAADVWHSTVTEAELVAAAGLLQPNHPETAATVKAIIATVERRPSHRIVVPDREIWMEAGILSGMLARLQNYASSDRRRAMNDALLLATARKYGLTVLTRNVVDFDWLQQLEPTARVLLYERR